MTSEENLSLEKESSEKKISLEKSSPVELSSKAPLENQSKTEIKNATANHKTFSTSDTQPFLNLALKDLQLSREKLERELEELSKKKVQIDNELKSSFSGQSDAIAEKSKVFRNI
tara:strand:- start:512 stop:856 length:345 start_codon:yes stop_codon:yes gene_type:complete